MPFIVALALGLVLTPLLARLGPVVGLVDRPSGDELKIHAEPMPLTGGLAVAAATLVTTAIFGELSPLLAMAAILVVLAVGVADDLASLPPLVRIAPELGAGIMMAVAGVTFAPLDGLGKVAVVLAVPVLANAVNIVDGQDGLAGGLAAAAALGITGILAAQGDPGAFGPALLASLLAFLLWNRPPAKVFLGDGGAYAVGGALVLLAATASQTWQELLGVTVCLGVFWLEVCSTVVRRLVRRESLVGGDRAHAYDLLALELSSRTRATAIMVAAGGVLAILGWVTARVSLSTGVAIACGAAVAGTAAVLGLWRARRSGPRRSR